ncbi:MAG: hypothetical protein ACRD1H_01620 [Vicinamibacterales bacterium]
MAIEIVDDDDELYRRIAFDDISDNQLNRGAFSLRPGEEYLSVDLARLTTAEECLARPQPPRPDLGLVVVRAGDVRALGLTVVHDPLFYDDPGRDNPAHARIAGENSRLVKKRLSGIARVLVYPTQCS